MSADLIVILAIAAFVVWKYRQILGHKTGHDVETPKERLHQRREKAEERVVQLKQYQKDDIVIDAQALQVDKAYDSLEEDQLKEAVDQMKKAEQGFSLEAFLQGAKGAFEMLMDAFNKQDRNSLKMLLSDELYDEFDQELKQYEKRDQQTQTTLISIETAEVKEAEVNKNKAQITVRFVSEQIHMVTDKEGEVVEGDKSRIEKVEDEWVFERNLKSRNPNWTIVDM